MGNFIFARMYMIAPGMNEFESLFRVCLFFVLFLLVYLFCLFDFYP